ncbi:putative lysozyme-like protein [Aricia agestis]|uniref:putative lysozyme-like protein n=1 Tax=Aricia agestis TaxID=91739 RepID=UPI001C205056|nr:putative lysozyme-like protein [Aricia agestis]
MVAARTLLLALACLAVAAAAPGPRVRRQLADDDALQPIDDAAGDEQTRDKRKFEGITQAKYGVKNAILGFVFGKINSLIDSKTRFIDDLDRKNIELNKQYGIEPPAAGGLSSLTSVIGQVIGPKLQLIGPKIQPVLGLIGGASGGSSGAGGSGGGSGLGSILSLVTSLSGGSSGGGGGGGGGAVATVDSSEEDDS